MNRTGIFVMYDSEGIVDDYRLYIIKEMRLVCSRLIVTVNGLLTDKSINQVKEYTDEIYYRTDDGFDAGAIKDTLIKYITWEKVIEMDELMWCNDSCYGPFIPFQTIIEQMEGKGYDFWGLTYQDSINSFFPKTEYNERYLPKHIQPYFMLIRKRMIKNSIFKEFWETLPPICDHSDAIINYELRFTRFFEDNGYVGGVYIELRDRELSGIDDTDIWIMDHPYTMIQVYNMPMVKRRIFTSQFDKNYSYSIGQTPDQILRYIKDHTDYDTGYIWKNIIRILSGKELSKNMNLRFVINEEDNNAIRKLFRDNQYMGVIIYDNRKVYRTELNLIAEADGVFLKNLSDRELSEYVRSKGFYIAQAYDTKQYRMLINEYKNRVEIVACILRDRNQSVSFFRKCLWLSEEFWKMTKTKQYIYLYGAGNNAKVASDLIKNTTINISGIIVSKGHRTEERKYGYRVYELPEIKLDDENTLILITVEKNGEIIESLKQIGFNSFSLMRVS